MIVKLRTYDNGWEYFNCPKGVKVRELTKEQWSSVWNYEKDTSYVIADIPGNMEQKEILEKKMVLIYIYDVMKIYIESNFVVYLLNNEGKTIEKLN